MNNRLKELRKELGLTMEAFGNRIGIGKASISRIEAGSISLTDRNIDIVCKEFHVNETWLRTGEGEMFIHMEREEKIATFIGSLAREQTSFKKDIISVLASLDTEEWEMLERVLRKFTKTLNESEEA